MCWTSDVEVASWIGGPVVPDGSGPASLPQVRRVVYAMARGNAGWKARTESKGAAGRGPGAGREESWRAFGRRGHRGVPPFSLSFQAKVTHDDRQLLVFVYRVNDFNISVSPRPNAAKLNRIIGPFLSPGPCSQVPYQNTCSFIH